MSTLSHTGKVVIISLQRTGTTSLGVALLDLDFSVLGTPNDKGIAEALLTSNTQPALETAARFDALQDLPWAVLYKELDTTFPGSKFILVEREPQSWIKSMLNHFGHNSTNMRKWAYGAGTPTGHEELYLEKYRAHYREVREYFRARPDDLLEMSLENGDGWEKLCPFLGMPIPDKRFPHTNKSKKNYSLWEKTYARARSLVPQAYRRKILDVLGFEDRRKRFNNFD